MHEILFIPSPFAPRHCLLCGRLFMPQEDRDQWCLTAHEVAWRIINNEPARKESRPRKRTKEQERIRQKVQDTIERKKLC